MYSLLLQIPAASHPVVQNCSNCELEVQVLGSQPLTALRDLIACPNDLTIPGDLSDDPDARARLPVAAVHNIFTPLSCVLYSGKEKISF